MILLTLKLQSHLILDFILGSEKQISIVLGLLMDFQFFIYFVDPGKFKIFFLNCFYEKADNYANFLYWRASLFKLDSYWLNGLESRQDSLIKVASSY